MVLRNPQISRPRKFIMAKALFFFSDIALLGKCSVQNRKLNFKASSIIQMRWCALMFPYGHQLKPKLKQLTVSQGSGRQSGGCFLASRCYWTWWLRSVYFSVLTQDPNLLVSERRLLWRTLRWPCTKNEWQKCHFAPPPPLRNENLEVSSQVGLQNFKCHFTPIPPPRNEKLEDLELPSTVGLQIYPPPLQIYFTPNPKYVARFLTSDLHRDALSPWGNLKVYHLPSILRSEPHLTAFTEFTNLQCWKNQNLERLTSELVFYKNNLCIEVEPAFDFRVVHFKSVSAESWISFITDGKGAVHNL